MKSIHVRVLPRSSRNEVVGEMADGTLKVKLTAAPVDGKANDALVALLADHFSVKKSAITITAGKTSRNKTISLN